MLLHLLGLHTLRANTPKHFQTDFTIFPTSFSSNLHLSIKEFLLMSSQIVNQDWRNVVTQQNQQFFPSITFEESEEKNKWSFSMKLPGFSKDRLRINLNTRTRIIVVTGQKSDGLFNITRLNERVTIKEDCLLEGVQAKLSNDTLIVTFEKEKK
ncbi:hypothetical protein Csa_005322 [Cucumis sativus]|nr:hypothetical protein Csa_005322 [Cucumis sativus]